MGARLPSSLPSWSGVSPRPGMAARMGRPPGRRHGWLARPKGPAPDLRGARPAGQHLLGAGWGPEGFRAAEPQKFQTKFTKGTATVLPMPRGTTRPRSADSRRPKKRGPAERSHPSPSGRR